VMNNTIFVKFDIHYNVITGTIPIELFQISSLTLLSLSFNMLQGTLEVPSIQGRKDWKIENEVKEVKDRKDVKGELLWYEQSQEDVTVFFCSNLRHLDLSFNM
jgi:hypothetical protein